MVAVSLKFDCMTSLHCSPHCNKPAEYDPDDYHRCLTLLMDHLPLMRPTSSWLEKDCVPKAKMKVEGLESMTKTTSTRGACRGSRLRLQLLSLMTSRRLPTRTPTYCNQVTSQPTTTKPNITLSQHRRGLLMEADKREGETARGERGGPLRP